MVTFNSIHLTLHADKLSRADWLRLAVKHINQTECFEWPFAIGQGGYGNLLVEGRHKNAHRFVCELRHGSPPAANMQAAHSCGNRRCINPAHLAWKTPVQNNADKIAHGTTRRGPKSNFVALTLDEVENLRKLKAENPELTCRQLQELTGIPKGNVWCILTGKTWRGVTANDRQQAVRS